MSNGYQPLPSDKPRGAPPRPPIMSSDESKGDPPETQHEFEISCVDIERYKFILESIANNIHADDMARVEACKALMGVR